MFFITSMRIVYRACIQWSDNGDSRLGAALAYYTLFSVVPLLLIAVQTAGQLFSEQDVRERMHDQLVVMMGPEIATGVEKLVETAGEQQASSWASSLSVLLLIVAALGAFLHTRTTLCMIWKLDPPRGNTWLGLLWDYCLAIAMVLVTALLLLASLAASLAVPIFDRIFPAGSLETHWQWVEWASSFVYLTIVFATVYRVLSGGRIDWGYVWYGSFIAAVLFTIGKTLFSYYTVYFAPASMYGAAGSVMVFLMWVYYSSQILFFGAELIQARRTRFEWMKSKLSEADVLAKQN